MLSYFLGIKFAIGLMDLKFIAIITFSFEQMSIPTKSVERISTFFKVTTTVTANERR